MKFGDLYEFVEVDDIRVVDGEKSYYARVNNQEFDYDSIVGREIERIFVDAAGNLAVELKYQPAMTVKDLLSACESGRNIKVVWTGSIQHTRKARCIEIYGDRKVKAWNCDQVSILIAIDGNIDTDL